MNGPPKFVILNPPYSESRHKFVSTDCQKSCMANKKQLESISYKHINLEPAIMVKDNPDLSSRQTLANELLLRL